MLEPWRQLARQTHLHLLLVGDGHEVEGFYEFENNFGFDDAVETIDQLDKSQMTDFAKAEQEYFETYSLARLWSFVKTNI